MTRSCPRGVFTPEIEPFGMIPDVFGPIHAVQGKLESAVSIFHQRHGLSHSPRLRETNSDLSQDRNRSRGNRMIPLRSRGHHLGYWMDIGAMRTTGKQALTRRERQVDG